MDSPETQQSPWAYWLRWLAVLPAAFLAYFVSQLLYILGQSIFREYSDWWIQLVNSAIGPASFVYFGALVAPSHRVHTSIALAIITCSIHISILTLSSFASKDFGWNFVWLLTCLVAGIVAAIGVCFHFFEEEK
jgi:hypothetical protein